MSIRDLIAVLAPEALLLREVHFDAAIVGLIERFDANGHVVNVAYDKTKVLEVLQQQMEGTEDEKYESAQEYFDFNIDGAYVGPHAPVFFTKREDIEEQP